MHRLLPLTVVALAATPAAALAAAKPGAYSGTTSGKYVQVGMAEEPTDRGTVSFRVSGNRVQNFRVRKQYFQCPAAEVPVTVKSIRLDRAGKGSAIYKDPNVGALKVSITVSSAGKATGTIVRPRSATGLCSPDHPVRFRAKRS